mmetsp:Transcript_22411/g.63523  ORF Transcript_22411/g.63523 Transcript_22411/m.63523 type:complete len:445 (+) Transcript_22411:85-1419(+)
MAVSYARASRNLSTRPTSGMPYEKSILRALVFMLMVWTLQRIRVGNEFVVSSISMRVVDDVDAVNERASLAHSNAAESRADCDEDFLDNKVVLDAIEVAAVNNENNNKDGKSDQQQQPVWPKIACFIMTHSGNHKTRVRKVLATWGKRCDRLILASNVTDDAIGAIAMTSKATWQNLWRKLQETLEYVWDDHVNHHHHLGRDNAKHDPVEQDESNDAEWFFLKADDDSYIIMENLKSFLAQQMAERNHNRNNNNNHNDVPLIFGRHFGVSIKKLKQDVGDPNYVTRIAQHYEWDRDDGDGDDEHTAFRFPSGGSAYVFNQAYMKLLVDGIHNASAYSINPKAKPPEDLSQALLAYEQSDGSVVVQPTRDEAADHAERFHMFAPSEMYSLERWKPHSWVYKMAPDGIQKGERCCSKNTVSFHQMDRYPGLMEYMERQLYECRRHP